MESALQKLVKFGGRKTNYFRSVVFPTPKPPTFPCTTKGLAALWTLAGEFVLVAGDFAHVFGLDVRHGYASVPCLDYVTGLDVGNGSGERFCWCFWEHSLISIILCIFMEIFL